ncbi:hypothetical protein AB0J90_33520 [Micromonospora sp. NPDC049523]|uniref:hypothetical protein n=1 Tax=Micromonospora sp. NPDC049523 TaxID=3155921 RepID=UPI00341E22B4
MVVMANRFMAESAMYESAASHAETLVCHAGEAHPFFQVAASAGIPDLVLAVFDHNMIAFRVAHSLMPIIDAADVTAMFYLASRVGEEVEITTAQIARHSGMSPGYLSSIVLPRLLEGGHVVRLSRGRWKATHGFSSTITHLVTIEAKLNAWKRALSQATRHAIGADLAWVVLDDHAIKPALRNLQWFHDSRVGIAGLNASGALAVHKSPPSRPSWPLQRLILTERVTRLYLDGQRTWQWASLFGSGGV